MRTESGAGCWRERLDGVTFVQQLLFVKLTQQVPYGFDVLVVVRGIRIIHIDPVAHRFGELFPHAGVFHYILAAGSVELLNGNFCSDIFLGDTLCAFNGQLNGQTVGVPACFALHKVTLLGFVAAENVFDGSGHHMMDTRNPVGRRGPFIKDKGRLAFACFNRFFEDALLFPERINLLVDF